jgi:hypothetical protein
MQSKLYGVTADILGTILSSILKSLTVFLSRFFLQKTFYFLKLLFIIPVNSYNFDKENKIDSKIIVLKKILTEKF